jgi:hypothetical protein
MTLRDYLNGPRAPIAARIDLAKRVLTAFGRLHDRGRVHGRIDASLILLEGARSFRIEVRLDEDEPHSGLRDVRMRAPEADATPRGDVYALGLLLRELLADDELPEGIARLVDLMAAADPNERYANAHVAMCALVRATMA